MSSEPSGKYSLQRAGMFTGHGFDAKRFGKLYDMPERGERSRVTNLLLVDVRTQQNLHIRILVMVTVHRVLFYQA